MSRSRREVQQHLPFTAAFALIQALRDPSGMLVRDTEEQRGDYTSPNLLSLAPSSGMENPAYAQSHEYFRPDFMNALSDKPLSEKKERGSHFGYGD
ncbi:hypothetical protein [Saccharibacillus sacchari]|uniref:Uncharacterized protein n=1 Tax=Saccharibacillus sacchari TaxID=456493 RepID=A0ACC6PKB6_9BACL